LGLAVWSPTKSIKRAKKFRLKFIEDNLKSHSINLSSCDLTFFRTDNNFLEYLIQFSKQNQVSEIYFSKSYSFEELSEESEVSSFCNLHNIKIFSFDQETLMQVKDLPFAIINMPNVFTDFRKKCEAQLHIEKPKDQFFNVKLYEESIGESAAIKRVREFIWETRAIVTYKETRNGMLDFNDSSKFSPWLSIGAISARRIYDEIKKFEDIHGANDSTYWLFFELLWRDYFKFLSLKYGRFIFSLEGIKSKNVKFNNHSADLLLFKKWCDGETSEEFVNANMNELNSSGFMSNRGRQNVASFLIHDLNLPWIWGAAYFEEHLIDYDPESNWGNWLYLSGKGTDPRSRVFNIKKQAHDYDPLGLYQKRWKKVPADF